MAGSPVARAAWRALASAFSTKVTPSSRSSASGATSSIVQSSSWGRGAAQQRNDLAQLALVAGGDDDLHGRARSIASRWRANSVFIASAASATSAPYCSAEKAPFSAVA